MDAHSKIGNACNPLVSVVLPVFNAEEFLDDALLSITRQTHSDFELIAVYDKSTDSSLEILKRWSSIDERIRVIFGEGSLIKALNIGLAASRGTFIARMDADDISAPERLEKQLLTMESSGADICGSHWFVTNQNGTILEAKIAPQVRDAFGMFLLCGVPFAHGSVMLRRSFLFENKLCYEGTDYAEDYDLWIRMWQKQAVFANVDDFLFYYRDSGTSLSKRGAAGTRDASKRLRRRFMKQSRHALEAVIQGLLACYDELSLNERVFMILASYQIFLEKPSLLFFNVLRTSSKRSIGVALLYLARGI